MTLLNIVGFETGTLDTNIETNTVVGGMAVQSSVVRTGSYALRANFTTTAAGYVDIRKHNTTGILNIGLSRCYYRFYFRADTLPSSNNEEIAAILSSTAYKLTLRITSAGKLQVYNRSHSQMGSDGSTTLSTGTWYRIDIDCDTGASAAYEVRINGVVEFSGTGDLHTVVNDRIALGKVTNRNGNTVDFFYDDVAIDDTGYPPVGAVAMLVPDGDGTYTTWTVGAGGGDDWTNVDEVTYDGDTTYLLSTTSVGDASTVTLESSASKSISGTIDGVKALVIVKRNTSNSKIQARIRSGSTDSDTANITIGSTYSAIGYILETDPDTAAAWTVGGINGVEIGAEERSASVSTRMTAAYLMVDFDVSVSAGDSLASKYGMYKKRRFQHLLNR
jgi:hypothetical protein